MKTTGLITYIQRKAPDWDRATLLSFLNDVQSMVFSSPNGLMRVIDNTTGKDPVLRTKAGQLVYVLDEREFGWDINFVKMPKTVNGQAVNDEYTNYNFSNGSSGLPYRVRNAAPGVPAKIIFDRDPLDNEYSIQCYRAPIRLTSERIQLEIPEYFHISHVAKGVLGIIEDAEHGTSNAWEKFEKELLPTLKWEMEKTYDNMIVYNQGKGY